MVRQNICFVELIKPEALPSSVFRALPERQEMPERQIIEKIFL